MKVLSSFQKYFTIISTSRKFLYALLILVMFLATFLRFYKLSTLPASLNWDEVATGYNANSILHTGKDEFGKSFPLYFRSYDDYKQPVYMYMTVGSIALFGYNDFAVRLPSAFFGTLTVLVFFFLVQILTKKSYLALLSAFILSVLPWHVQFSHYALESNVGLFFELLGFLLLLLSFEKRRWLLPLSILSFGIATYTYLSYRVVLPLFGLVILTIYRRDIFKKEKYLYAAIIIGIFFFGLLAYDNLTQGVHARFQGTSVLNDYSTFKHTSEEMVYDGVAGSNLPRRFFHETPVLTQASLIIRGYLTHFGPDFLFFDLDQPLHHAPGVGFLYLWMIPFIPLGMYFLIRAKQQKIFLFFFTLLIIAPIPASVTWDIPHAVRTETLLIPFTLFAAFGIYQLLELLFRRNIFTGLISSMILSVLIGVSAFYFFHQYTIHFPHERSELFQYGRKEMTAYLEKNKDTYDKIFIHTDIDKAYMFMLYYSQYDPAVYLKQGGTISGSFREMNNHYDTYHFKIFDFNKDLQKGTLFVGLPGDFPKNIQPLYQINELDDTRIILFATSDQIKPLIQDCLDKAKITPIATPSGSIRQECFNLGIIESTQKK